MCFVDTKSTSSSIETQLNSIKPSSLIQIKLWEIFLVVDVQFSKVILPIQGYPTIQEPPVIFLRLAKSL